MTDQILGLGGVDFRAYDNGDHHALAVMDAPYNAGSNRELIAGTAAAAGPSVACRVAHLKAATDNAGTIFVGLNGTAVTVPDGTADVTSGWPLTAGQEKVLSVDNLSRLGYVANAAAQVLIVMAQG